MSMFASWKNKIKTKLATPIANFVSFGNPEIHQKVRVVREKLLAWQTLRNVFKENLVGFLEATDVSENNIVLRSRSVDTATFDRATSSAPAIATAGPVYTADSTPPTYVPLAPQLRTVPPRYPVHPPDPYSTLRSSHTAVPKPPAADPDPQVRISALRDFKAEVDQAKSQFHSEAKALLVLMASAPSNKNDASCYLELWALLLLTLREEDALCHVMSQQREKERLCRRKREERKEAINAINAINATNTNTTNTPTCNTPSTNTSPRADSGIPSSNPSPPANLSPIQSSPSPPPSSVNKIGSEPKGSGSSDDSPTLELGTILLFNEEVQECIYKIIQSLMLREEFLVGLTLPISSFETVERTRTNTGGEKSIGLTSKMNFTAKNVIGGGVQVSKEELQLAHRYREMLLATQVWVDRKLKSALADISNYYPSSPLGQFCSNVLAINSIRLPWLMEILLDNIRLKDDTRRRLQEVLGERAPSDIARTRSLQQQYLVIFGWRTLSDYLDDTFLQYEPIQKAIHANSFLNIEGHILTFQLVAPQASIGEIQAVSRAAATLLSRVDTVCVGFAMAWFSHLEDLFHQCNPSRCIPTNPETADPALEDLPMAIRGFREISDWFLFYTLEKTDTSYSRFQVEGLRSLLGIKTGLICEVMKVIFSRTRVYDFQAVVEGLNFLQCALTVVGQHATGLPPLFDTGLFIKALDAVFQTDHFRCVQKALALIYTSSNLFSGESRKCLFSEFLLDKYFFQLFLHWNSNVRNTFQQLLAFKLPIAKEPESSLRGASLLSHDLADSTALNGFLRVKLEQYLFALKAQLNSESGTFYPMHLQVYVPKAVTEFTKYCDMYVQWEASGNPEPPHLQPLYSNCEPAG